MQRHRRMVLHKSDLNLKEVKEYGLGTTGKLRLVESLNA